MTGPNTSATGGFLAPVGPAVPEDDDLDDLLTAAVEGITGLPGAMIRPRWQATPPKQLEPSTNWCSIGVTDITPDANASLVHDGAANGGLGRSTEYRGEEIGVLASFYGPGAHAFAAVFRDGIAIGQNRETLRAQGLAYVSTDRITAVPDLINQQWVRRVDVAITFRRLVARTYEIQNLARAPGAITADGGSVDGLAAITTPFQAG